jgi:hypothetical protein
VDNRAITIDLGMMGEPEDPSNRIEYTMLHAKEMKEIPLRSSE